MSTTETPKDTVISKLPELIDKSGGWVSPFRTEIQSPGRVEKLKETAKKAAGVVKDATGATGVTADATAAAPTDSAGATADTPDTPDTAMDAATNASKAADDDEANAGEETFQDEIRESRFNSSSSSSSNTSSSSSSSSHIIPLSEDDPNLKTLQSKPKLLSRYKDNVNIVAQSMDKNKLVNPDRIIGLGSGLAMTQVQLMEIAKRRVQPMLKDVDALVEKQKSNDAVRHAQEHQAYTEKDQSKVQKKLDKFKKQLDKENEGHKLVHAEALASIVAKMEQSKKEHDEYVTSVNTQMEQDIKDAEEAEEAASKQHEDEKTLLFTDFDELKQEKINDLQETKRNQTKETEDAAKFEEDGHKLQAEADEKEAQLAKEKAEVEDITTKLQTVIDSKHAEKTRILEATTQKKQYNRSLLIVEAQHARAVANTAKLHSHVALLKNLVDKRSSQLENLKGPEKEKLATSRKQAEKSHDEWEKVRDEMKSEEAHKQERIRIQKEAERKRLDEEKEEAKKQKKHGFFSKRMAKIGAGIGIGGAAVAGTAVGASKAGAAGTTKVVNPAKSIKPSNTAKAVKPSDTTPTKPSDTDKPSKPSDTTPTKPSESTPTVPKTSTPTESEADSLETPKATKPVFTEVVDGPNAQKAESSYDDTVSYETVTKEEYEANKNDPNYMIV
ncbi:hypothetical protein FOA43_001852 [Brettanomyces nanus]|uniref:Uncharacterized protein n=1 Tax=Eeniella nana TaxID=13502 RepID=A0A875S387_EENNA|nr:uncharacterized protein FOA43_001852 [Brettanomyces nanus]QPG74522.1 hypothetical protein FOA43_001852 [Brettanomyces nanus]